MLLKPGTTLHNESYRIISPLGRGGFGVTYLAEEVMAKRKVCIKEFFPKDYYKRDNDTHHTIGAGDTFGSIAIKSNTTSRKTQELNPEVNPTILQIGQKIRVR